MVRKLILALAAPLLLVACAQEAEDQSLDTDRSPAGADADASPISALRAAPDLAADAGSARFEMVVAIDSPEGELEMLATGGYEGDRMSMEMDLGTMLSGLAEATGESIPPGFDEPMQIVFDGELAYVRMPMLDMLTGTSGWLSASPEDLGQQGSLGLGGAASSPTQVLETLRGVADDVEELGAEDVRGVETTRYRATVDFEDVLAGVPDEQREQMQAQLDQLGGADIDSLPVEVWIDGDGLARRLEMALEDTGAMGAPGSVTLTIDLFDYGQPFSVEVPPAEEVTPLAEVMPGMAGGLG